MMPGIFRIPKDIRRKKTGMAGGKKSITIGAGKMDEDDKSRLSFAGYLGLRFLVFMVILAGAIILMERC